MENAQPGILAGVPAHARFVHYDLLPGVDPKKALAELRECDIDDELVIALGSSLVWASGGAIEGLGPHPAMVGPGISVPSTPHALLLWHRGEDRGDVVLSARELEEDLGDYFEVQLIVDAFKHQEGRDLTGYVDGTENPSGDDARGAALIADAGPGLDGSSFVATQKWKHDLAEFFDFDDDARDQIIGRRAKDDVELEDAPASAHVKRTDQEAFAPPAFVLRRSMPWADEDGEGLFFVAFGKSFDAYEKQLRRMVGMDDGVIDALFRFTRPMTGSYFWCPPVDGGHLDLRALGL
ncbi:MAG: peroxidase [Deltaproteobacteria bacterium]|nr:MAG: peroxidase [Deltaproteobacteria bacterium]